MKAVEDGELRMTLWEHLGELRNRLFKVVVCALVLGVGALVFARPIFGLLMRPVLDALPPEGRALVYTSGIEELNVLMKVGLYAGIFLTTPVILWQIWGFVSPGLYPSERRLAGPFVVLGTLAFLAGASFCYFFLLPTMFQFLLMQEDAAPLERKLSVANLEEEDALRFLTLGDAPRAGELAKAVSLQLKDSGRLTSVPVVPAHGAELADRLGRMGRLLDSARAGMPPEARPALKSALEKRISAVEALAQGNLAASAQRLEEAAALIGSASAQHAEEMAELWKLEKGLADGKARYQAQAWTRPMLTMNEQLSLVLVLLLALGIIFELPLVMAVLALAGLVKAKTLFKYQRHALVLCLVAAAIITPTGDAVNLALMAAPMLLCYEVGVVAVWLIERRRDSKAAAAPA